MVEADFTIIMSENLVIIGAIPCIYEGHEVLYSYKSHENKAIELSVCEGSGFTSTVSAFLFCKLVVKIILGLS